MNARVGMMLFLLIASACSCGGLTETDERATRTSSPACTAQALATDELDAVAIVADANDVYWIAQGTQGVPSSVRHRSLHRGAERTDDFARGSDESKRALALALDGENIYWTTNGGPLIAKPRAGGEERILHDTLGPYPKALAVDDAYVYVGTTSGPQDSDRRLVRITKADGAMKTLATTKWRVETIAVTDDGWVLWTGGDPLLYKVHREGGEPIALSSRPIHSQSLATNGSLVAWTRWEDGIVEGMSIDGRSSPFELARGRNHPTAISIDATGHATWTDFGSLPKQEEASDPDGAVVRAPLRANAPLEVLATSLPSPTSAVVVGGAVLYTTRGRHVPGARTSDRVAPRESSVRCVSISN